MRNLTPHPNPPPQGERGRVAPVAGRGGRVKGTPSPLAGEGREGGWQPPVAHHESVAPRLRANARRMRSDQTLAEMRLWRELRGHKLEGLGFRRQVPMGRFIADFVCHEAKLVVEIDGATHGTLEEVRHDRQRDAWLRMRGYRTLRFWNDAIREDIVSVVEAIRQACSGVGAVHPAAHAEERRIAGATRAEEPRFTGSQISRTGKR